MKFLKFMIACFLFTFLFSCQEQKISSNIEESAVASLAGEELSLGIADFNVIRDVGQVQYINLEGGFWGIVGSNGKYKPVNLSRDYCVEGLWVIFTAEAIDDNTFTQWGKLIKIIRIEKVKERIVTDTGIIKLSGDQGKTWLIEGIKATYQPLNLPVEFQKEGLLVKFSAIIKTDVIIIPGLWPAIEILKIENVTDPLIVKLREEFKIPEKKSAYEPSEKILFTFDSVVSDNRYPVESDRFWEGEAIILVTVTIKGTNYGQFKLSTFKDNSSVVVGGFKFSLNTLYPYPSIDLSAKKEYIGYFTIEKPIQIML